MLTTVGKTSATSKDLVQSMTPKTRADIFKGFNKNWEQH